MNNVEGFVLSKSSELYRVTTSPNEVLKGKKYVSARFHDISTYVTMVGEIYGAPAGFEHLSILQPKRNLTVAGSREQAQLLMDIYGKQNGLTDKAKSAVAKGWIKDEILNTPIADMTVKQLNSYIYYNPYGHDKDILNHPITDPNTKRFVNALTGKGYDAAVDLVDTSIGYADTPMVLLKSEDSVTQKDYGKFDWDEYFTNTKSRGIVH